MRKLMAFVATIVFCVMFFTSASIYADVQKSLTIEINYNDVIPTKIIEIENEEGMSALEVLQKVAVVETHPLGGFVMVIAIDEVKGERGKMAWYYSVNDKSADKIAFNNIIDKNVESIKWIYKEDVCSKKVDGDIY